MGKYDDSIYEYPIADHVRTRKKPIPYERMSKLAQHNHDARALGMTYGQYMAKYEAEKKLRAPRRRASHDD